MSRERLDGHLRRYYGSQQLDATTLERLKQLAQVETRAEVPESSTHGSQGRRRFASRLLGATTAVAALVLLTFVLPALRSDPVARPEALAGSIAREIALNHVKNLTVEFPAEGYPGLREQMGKLDFSLRSPEHTGGGGAFRVIGGRYCSIQGQLAAQIKLEDGAGRLLTLYQTDFSEDFEGLSMQQRELEGIQIRIWREGDLLFGLAASEI